MEESIKSVQALILYLIPPFQNLGLNVDPAAEGGRTATVRTVLKCKSFSVNLLSSLLVSPHPLPKI